MLYHNTFLRNQVIKEEPSSPPKAHSPLDDELHEAKNSSCCNLKTSPIFRLSSLFAIFPFTLNRHVRVRYISLLYSLCLIIVFGQLYFIEIKRILQTVQPNTNVLLFSGYVTMNTVLCVATIVTPLTNRDSIVRILKYLAKVDGIISRTRLPHQLPNDTKRQRWQVIFIVTVSGLFYAVYRKATEENIFSSFGKEEFYILPITWLMIFQIDYFMVHISNRFSFVNTQMERALAGTKCDNDNGNINNENNSNAGNIRKDEIRVIGYDNECNNHFQQQNDNNLKDNNSNTNDNAVYLNTDTLNCLNRIHYTLYTTFHEITKVYSVQLLIIVPRVIFFSVIPVHYNIVTALVKDPNESSSPHVWTHIFTLSFTVLLAAPIIYAVNISTKTVNQVLRTSSCNH